MQLKNPDLLKQQVFIDGLWMDAADGKSFAVTNPATGETIAQVPSVSTAQVEQAEIGRASCRERVLRLV